MANIKMVLEMKRTGEGAFTATVKDLEGIDKAFEKTKQSASSFSNFLQGMGQGAGQAAFATMVGAIQAVPAALADAVAGFVAAGGALADLSAKTTLSTTALQEYAFAGSLVGVSSDAIANSVLKMTRIIGEGSDKTTGAVKALGLSFGELRSMNPEEQFRAISTALQGISDPTQQVVIGTQLMGRGFAEILPLIRSGFEDARQEAHQLGAVMSEEMVQSADAAGDAATRLGAAWTGVKNQLAAAMVQAAGGTSGLNDLAQSVAALTAALRADNEAGTSWLAWLVKANPLIAQFNLLMAAASEPGRHLMAAPKVTPFEGSPGSMDNFKIQAEGIKIAAEQTKAYEKALKGAVATATELERIAVAKDMAKALSDSAANAEELADAADRAADELHKAKDRAEQLRQEMAQVKKINEDLQSAFDILDAKRKEQEEEALKRNQDMVAGLRQMASAFENVGGVFGMVGGGILGILANLKDETLQGASAWEKWGMAVEGAMAAYSGGKAIGEAGGSTGAGALRGAMTGAMAGAAFGPVGMAAGAVIGGAIGFFGAKAGQKKALEEAKKQFEELQKAIVSTYGSLEEFQRLASGFGIDLTNAFDPAHPEALKAAMDQLNDAMKQHEENLKNLAKLSDLLAERAQILTDQMRQSGKVTDDNRDAFRRMEHYALAAFGTLVKETGDVLGALLQMGPAIDRIAAAQREFGLESSRAFQDLKHLNNWVKGHQELAAEVSNLNQLFQTFGDLNMLNGQILQDLAADVTDLFDKLIDGGLSANDAIATLAPSLQRLWEQQQRTGVQFDEQTQRLIDAAVGQGVVGDQFKDTFSQILDVLLTIADVLGAEIPAYLDNLAQQARNMPPLVPPLGGGDYGFSGESKPTPPGHASGYFNPELPYDYTFKAHKGERIEITPASDTSKRNAMGGSVSLSFPGMTINAQPGQDPQAIGAAVVDAVESNIRRRGKILLAMQESA